VELAGKMDIVYTGAFFHLFSLENQEKIAARIVQRSPHDLAAW